MKLRLISSEMKVLNDDDEMIYRGSYDDCVDWINEEYWDVFNDPMNDGSFQIVPI